MRAVFLLPYPAYPPHGGGMQRMYQLLRHLAQHHELWMLGLSPSPEATAAAQPLSAFGHLTLLPAPQRTLPGRAWQTLTSPQPDMVLRAPSAPLRTALAALLRTHSPEVVQACSIEMAQYALQARAPGRIAALDSWNAEYLLQRRAALADLRTPRRLHAGLYSLIQWQKLRRYEQQLGRRLDMISVVSAADAASLRRIGVSCPLPVVPNGVDTSFFRPQAGSVDPNLLLFTGTLDFRANIDALRWFVEAVLPLIRQQRPAVRLLVLGRNPAPAITALAAAGTLELRANLPDIRPFFAQAAAYVLPMRIGGGVRLKLLEAFACGVPVVTTPMGAEGIPELAADTHCLLAADPAAFAAATLCLLDERALAARIAAAARALVVAHYAWAQIAPRLEAAWHAARNG